MVTPPSPSSLGPTTKLNQIWNNKIHKKLQTSCASLNAKFGITDSIVSATCSTLFLNVLGFAAGGGAGLTCYNVGKGIVQACVGAVVAEGIQREMKERRNNKRRRSEKEGGNSNKRRRHEEEGGFWNWKRARVG